MKLSREIDLFILIYLTVIVFSILYPASFFSLEMAEAVLRNMAIDGILAVGLMILMVAVVFDLSIGAMMSLAGVVDGTLMVEHKVPGPAAVLAVLLNGAVGGALNGLNSTRLKVNTLITTMATMGIFSGLALLVGGISVPNLPAGFTRLGQAEWPRIELFGQVLKLQAP